MTVLLSALSLAGTALKPVSESAVNDGYAALKALILRKFGADHPRLEPTLADYADDPETYEKPAVKVLREAGVEGDREVLDRALELLKQADGPRYASVTITASGDGSIAIGGSVSGSQIVAGGQTRAARDRG